MQPVARRLDTTFRLFREDEVNAMREALEATDRPHIAGPKPYSFRFAGVTVRNVFPKPAAAAGRGGGPRNAPAQMPCLQLSVQIPPGHSVRGLNEKQRVRARAESVQFTTIQLLSQCWPRRAFACAMQGNH